MTTNSPSSIASSSHPMRFVEQPQSEWIVRSRPAHLRCTGVNAQRIRVKCNSNWLDDDRIYLERSTDPTSGEPSIRANVEIQRAELDAWFADLGEFACQCWAFGEGKYNEGKNEDLDSEEEEDDDEDERDDEENERKTTTRIKLKDNKQAIIRSDIARIRLACEFNIF
uniref:Ig-like domain-containing protein n=1 Tax=Meloidogyne hapla TaxID=6305 RepID=A0A1I8AYM5_MELHA